MKIYNQFIIIVSVLLLSTTVFLIVLKVSSLAIYYLSYVTEALICTELYGYFMPRARHGLNRVSIVLFAGFLIILIHEVINMI